VSIKCLHALLPLYKGSYDHVTRADFVFDEDKPEKRQDGAGAKFCVYELSIDRDLLGQEIGASTSNFLLIPRGSPTCYLAVRVSVQFPFGLHLLFLQTGLITTCEISSGLADCCETTREGLLTQLLVT
jgi:hypothetical protein